jgi:hypothetical protein
MLGWNLFFQQAGERKLTGLADIHRGLKFSSLSKEGGAEAAFDCAHRMATVDLLN